MLFFCFYIVDNVGQAEIRTVSVLDTTPERAVLTGGVQAGELVVLSPMERSRIEITLKVLDANDPNVVLVDPPKPDWQKEEDAKEEGGKSSAKKKKKNSAKSSDADGNSAEEN